MALIKAILKYVALLAVLIVAVFAITVGVMFTANIFNPNNKLEVFGYSLHTFNENSDNVLSEFDNGDFNTIQIDVKHLSVSVKGTLESAMHLDIYNKMWGLAKVDSEVNYGLAYAVEDSVLKISVTEPEGMFLNTASAHLELSVPAHYSAKNLIINGSNSAVAIGDSYANLNVEDVTFNVKDAKVSVNETKSLNNVTINSRNNKINIKPDVAGCITMNTGVSTLTFNHTNEISVNAKNAKIEASSVNLATIKSSSGILHLTTVNGDVNLDGNIKVKINNLNGNYADANRKSAKVELSNVTGTVSATSTSGETYINTVSGAVAIKTTIGNVTVKNISSSLSLNTTSGICQVEYASNVSADTTFTFTAKNGSLSAKNLNCSTNIQIQEKGLCSITAEFAKLVGENSIQAQKGSVKVTAPIQAHVLTVSSNTETDILYADLDTNQSISDQQISGAIQESETKLTIVSTSGKITLRAESQQ